MKVSDSLLQFVPYKIIIMDGGEKITDLYKSDRYPVIVCVIQNSCEKLCGNECKRVIIELLLLKKKKKKKRSQSYQRR